MESLGKPLSLAVGALLLVISTSLATFFIVSANNPKCESYRQSESEPLLKFTSEGTVDLVQTLKVPEKGITISKGLAGGRCFVLTNDHQHAQSKERTLSVLESELTHDQLEAMGGSQAVDFCKGLSIVPVEHLDEMRERRQAPPTNPNAGTVTNECAQRVIVQCANDTSVYKCVSGPKEAYRAKITCKNANQFTFDLTTRCKEFENTKSDRMSKCLEKIILSQQGAGGAPPPARK